MEELADFFGSTIGMMILSAAIPVLCWLIYIIAKNYKDSQDHMDL